MSKNGVALVWGALGECLMIELLKRPVIRGPHEVGGAEAGPERL